MVELIPQSSAIFLNVLADGTLRRQVDKNTEGAVQRDYETTDGAQGTKYELVYKAIKGTVEDISFYDSDYGEKINITIASTGSSLEQGEAVLQLGVGTPFGEDFLKKLPNINFAEEVIVRPYSFTDENDKDRRGVVITQQNEKIQNYFFDPENKKPINGYPEPEGEVASYTKDDWKIYFLKARKFLVQYAKEKVALPKKRAQESKKAEYPEESISPSDIPF